MEFCHGDLFQYEMANKNGEIKTALVVSSNSRRNDSYVNVIILTDEPKDGISVPITTNKGIMYADCGMISFALTYRFGEFLQSVKKIEMDKVDDGLLKALGLESRVVEKEVIKEVPNTSVQTINHDDLNVELSMDLASARKEAEIYKSLYESLLAKVMR